MPYYPPASEAEAITEITDVPTEETDTDLRLAPDGAGGTEWVEGGGTAETPPALRVYLFEQFK